MGKVRSSRNKGILKFTAVQATALNAFDSMVIYVTTTDVTFTVIGFWMYEGGTWNKA